MIMMMMIIIIILSSRSSSSSSIVVVVDVVIMMHDVSEPVVMGDHVGRGQGDTQASTNGLVAARIDVCVGVTWCSGGDGVGGGLVE